MKTPLSPPMEALEFIRILLTGAVAIGIVTGCMRRESPVAAGVRNQTLIVGCGNEPDDLDPHVVPIDFRILPALFEGLTRIDERTNLPVPAAAERWDVSPDGLTYTFYLRRGLRWSNGDPVTAADFSFSFERVLSPSFAARFSYLLHSIKKAAAFNTGSIRDFSEVGVRVLDDHTLRIDLEQPTPFLLALAAHATWLPVHRPTLEKFGGVAKRGTKWTAAGNLVSNGPFALAEWVPHSRIVASRNLNYWNAQSIHLNRIEFLPIESPDAEERNFRAGQQHVTWNVPLSRLTAYQSQTPSPLRVDPVLATFYVNFNVAKPPFDDARVRRALGLAIDRQALSKAVSFGTCPPATSFTPPNCGGYTARTAMQYDPDAARQLLAQAGFPGGAGLPEIPLLLPTGGLFPQMGEAIQAMWQRELGVRTAIEAVERTTLRQLQTEKRHTAVIWMWVADYPDVMAMLELFVSGATNNRTNWDNRDFDRLLIAAAKTPDAPARFEILQEAEALLLQEAPVIPFGHQASIYLVHPAVKAWNQSMMMTAGYQGVSLGR